MSFPPPIRPAQSGEPVAPRLTSRWFNTASAAAAAYARNGDGPTGGDITAKPLNPGTTAYVAFGPYSGGGDADFSSVVIKAGAVVGYGRPTLPFDSDSLYAMNAAPVYSALQATSVSASSDSPGVGAGQGYGQNRGYGIALEAKSFGVIKSGQKELVRVATSGHVVARVNVRNILHKFARPARPGDVQTNPASYAPEDPSVLHTDWTGPVRLQHFVAEGTGIRDVAVYLGDDIPRRSTVPIKIVRKDPTRENLWWGQPIWFAGQPTGTATVDPFVTAGYGSNVYDVPVLLLYTHPFDVNGTTPGDANQGPWTTTNPPYGDTAQLAVGRVYDCHAADGYGPPYTVTLPQAPGVIGTEIDELDITSATNDAWQDIAFTPDIWTPEPHLVIANVDVRIDPAAYSPTEYNEGYVVARLTLADGTPITAGGSMPGALMAKGHFGPDNIAYPFYGTKIPIQRRAHVTLFAVVNRPDQFDASPTRLKVQAAKYDQGRTRTSPYDSATFSVTAETIAVSLVHLNRNIEQAPLVVPPPPPPPPPDPPPVDGDTVPPTPGGDIDVP